MCPGVCSTRHSRPARESRSPSRTGSVIFGTSGRRRARREAAHNALFHSGGGLPPPPPPAGPPPPPPPPRAPASRAPPPASVPRGPRPAEIAASVEIAADGERRIYLRGALDERRALELAARVAAIQGGAADAVSVRLNGRLLFKTAGHGDAARATTHTLPGRAYAGLADPARAAATDHTDQE